MTAKQQIDIVIVKHGYASIVGKKERKKIRKLALIASQIGYQNRIRLLVDIRILKKINKMK